MNITVLTVLIEQSSQHQLLFFHYIVRRPPHSILFPTRRSSDLNTGVILGGRSFKRAAVSKDGSRFGACGHPSDRKSTRLNSSHVSISYAVFCLKKKSAFLRTFADKSAAHHTSQP